MIDFLRLGGIVLASLLVAVIAQRLWDRRFAARVDRAARRHDLQPPSPSDSDELLLGFPFLSSLGEVEAVGRWQGTRERVEVALLALRASAGPILGYTLFARRAPAWSARVVVRPKNLEGGPAEGSPDARRFAELDQDDLRAVLGEAGAWLQIEGPWRVVAIPAPVTPAIVSRLVELSDTMAKRVPEPEEFSGGLEWNV